MLPEPRNLDGKLRFGVYEADPRSGELRKHGVRIPLEDRPFRALLLLLRRANEVVTREELRKELWPSDVFIDFDHGLNTAIRKIRLALNDSADNPRFIETVGRRGYRFLAQMEPDFNIAPERIATETRKTEPVTAAAAPMEAREAPAVLEVASPESEKAHFRHRGRIILMAATSFGLLLAWLFRPTMPLPRVSRIMQLTKSGGARPTAPLYTDGPRVYYQSNGPLETDLQIRQVLLNGNEDNPGSIPGRFAIRGLSPDDTEFLAMIRDGEKSTVWTVPVAGGSPRRVGNLVADDITWSHDGNWLAYAQGNQLFLAKRDGTSSRPLAAVPELSAKIDHIRWSPDDRKLRFTAYSPGPGGTWLTPATRALWEIAADGRNLHQLRFPWPGKEAECCGEWTPDGRYFVFWSQRDNVANLWALEERADWWHRANRDPVQLTSGPVDYYQPVPSRNGKSIFAIGSQPSGELVRYDSARKQFAPFLGGRSLAHLAFSRDRQWVAYIDYPDKTLWRARIDGTEPLQLTFPPLQVGSPRWSLDGKRITFHANCPGCMWRSFVISVEGGNPEPFPAEPLSQGSPDWMPGRAALIYSRAYGAERPALYQFDEQTGRSEKISGTDGLYGATWSPDGRYLCAVDAATDILLLVDLNSGMRTQIAGPVRWPAWSPDSQYVYFVRDDSNWIFRVRVPDGNEEKTLEIPFRLTDSPGWVSWPFTVAPDGSLILLREHGRFDVYALSLSVP